MDGVLGCIRKDDIMAGKKSEFDKVFSAWDILVIAFGAMIGWGWVVSSGDWITRGGVIGAAIGFALGGVMVFFVGLTYAELTAAMPQCGGEHVFSYKAMGPIGSYISLIYIQSSFRDICTRWQVLISMHHGLRLQ